MAKQRVQSKWQIASARITNLKWEIEEALSTFSEDEKESEKYKQLLQTLDLLIEHILHKYRVAEIDKLQKENEELKKKSSWMSWRTLVAAVMGGLATEVAKYIVQFVAVIISGGAQP